MPKVGTANEPADVKRAAVADGVGRKEEPLELADNPGPPKLNKLAFFEMLSAMSEREWEDRMVYLYRGDGNVIKANEKDDRYIERIPHAFDEEYVKKKHGGGRFLALLKNVRVNGAERRHYFNIEGEPIIHDNEIDVRKKQGASGEKSETAMLIEQMERMVQRVMDISAKGSGAEQEAITKSVAMLSEASKGALQIQQKAIESTIGSSTGHPLVDKFLEASISKLGTETKQDSLDQLTKLLALMRELNKGNDRPAPPAGLLGNLGEIKGVLDVLKELGVKIGGGDVAAEGGMDWRSVLASTLPQGLQVLGGYIDRWMQQNAERNRILAGQVEAQRRQAGLPPQLPAPAPAPAPPVQTSAPQPAPPAPGPQPSALPPNFASAQPGQAAQPSNVVEIPPREAAAGEPGEQPQVVDLDFVCHIIRRCFDAGDSGDAPALMLKRIYDAAAIEPLRPYFSDATQLRGIASLSPIIAEIMNERGFSAFLEDFVEEMNLKEEEEPGPEPEGAPTA